MILRNWPWQPVALHPGKAYRHAFDEAEDLFRADGIALMLAEAVQQVQTLCVTLYPLQNGRPEFIEKACADVLLTPGCTQVEIPFALFNNRQRVRAHLKYIASITLELMDGASAVTVCAAGPMCQGNLLVTVEKSTCVGDPGDELRWKLHIRSGLNIPRCVALHADYDGREALTWEYPRLVTLPPLGEAETEITSVMLDCVPVGGVEERRFTILAEGRENQKITLFAARKRHTPFLLHTEAGWDELRRAIEWDETVREVFEREYLRVAEEWQVAEPATHHRFVYTGGSHDRLLNTAVAWKLTGNSAYLEKMARYFRGFVDEENGYLATRYCYFEFPKTPQEAPADKFLVHHANSGGWVQEGEFMARMAIAYDLCRNESCITPDMHAKLESCMRAYMAFVDWRQTDGEGNNFQICEAGGALYFALLLQDEALIRRFLSGSNGLQELISSVFADDGSYFEGATGYMKLAAEVYGRAAVSCQNAGRNLKDVVVPADFGRNVMHSPWSLRQQTAEDGKPFLGMSFERFESVRKPTRTLKDYYDCLLQLTEENGFIFSANDSNEQNFCRALQLGYYLYHDPAYLPVANRAPHPDLLFGPHMTPLGLTERKPGSYLNTGNGFAILREQGESPVQAVLKFGQHGGYHGHFDRLSLLSVIRDGKVFHNNEYAWFGYDSYLFKMWVQTSIAHNMVVVDDRMQEPTPCQTILFSDDGCMQAVCAQTTSRWCDPPYGGQTPYLAQFPQEKSAKEGRRILLPETPRPQGDIGEYSEPVFQRRLLVLLEGCCFVFDYAEAAHEHTFDCLYHPMGVLKAELPALTGHTPRFNEDPFGAGQFIVDCYHYRTEGPLCLRFENGRQRVNGNDQMDFAARTVLHCAWPPRQEMIIGRYPHGKDRFDGDYTAADGALLAEDTKKTVAFRQKGTSAGFVTALEIGDCPQGVQSVTAEGPEHIIIRRRDGRVQHLHVSGLSDREGSVSVTYE